MIGLHGVVTRDPDGHGLHRFAGSVPIFGCDSFELQSEKPHASASSEPSEPNGQSMPQVQVELSQETSGDSTPTTPQEQIELLKETIGEKIGDSTMELLKGAIDEASAELQQGLAELVGQIAAKTQKQTEESTAESQKQADDSL